MNGTILVRAALVGIEKQDDGTYQLMFRPVEPRSVERTSYGPWRICDRHGFSSPLAVLDACPDCHLTPEFRRRLEQMEARW